MSLEVKINNDIKEAMKAKEEARLRAIRAVKAQLLLIKTSGTDVEISEEMEIQLLQKMVKQRRDSLSIFEAQNREDLAKTERDEIGFIESYLPKQLSEAEIETAISVIIAETGATGMKDMGKIMSAANKQLAGKAAGSAISVVVKKLLS